MACRLIIYNPLSLMAPGRALLIEQELCKVDAVVLTGTRIRQLVLVGTPAIRLKNHNHDVTIIAFYMPVRTTLAAEQKTQRRSWHLEEVDRVGIVAGSLDGNEISGSVGSATAATATSRASAEGDLEASSTAE